MANMTIMDSVPLFKPGKGYRCIAILTPRTSMGSGHFPLPQFKLAEVSLSKWG